MEYERSYRGSFLDVRMIGCGSVKSSFVNGKCINLSDRYITNFQYKLERKPHRAEIQKCRFTNKILLMHNGFSCHI